MPLGLHPAEFVPAAPLLPVLAEVMGYAVAFGLCVIATYVVRALFAPTESFTAHIPWIGRTVSNGVHVIEQKLTHKLEEAVAGLDHRMAGAWYKLAHVAERIGHEIMANAGTLAAIAAVIAGLPGFSDWRAFIAKVKASLVWAERHAIGAVHTLTRPLHADVRALSRWTHAQIRTLRHSIAVTLPHEIAGLRHRTRTVEDALARDWKLIKKHERLLGIGALTGVVAVALSRLGLSWIRCGKLRTRGPALCNLADDLFEALLGGALAILGAISLAAFAHTMVELMDEFVGAVQGFISETHGVPARSAAEQGFSAPGGGIAFRSASGQGFV